MRIDQLHSVYIGQLRIKKHLTWQWMTHPAAFSSSLQFVFLSERFLNPHTAHRNNEIVKYPFWRQLLMDSYSYHIHMWKHTVKPATASCSECRQLTTLLKLLLGKETKQLHRENVLNSEITVNSLYCSVLRSNSLAAPELHIYALLFQSQWVSSSTWFLTQHRDKNL